MFVLLFLALAATMRAETDDLGRFSYVVVLSGDTAMEMTDSLFYSISRKVIFPVNKYIIPEDSPIREEISHEIMPYLNSNSYHLSSVMIRGASSSEGPRGWNETLSHRCAQAFIDMANDYSDTPVDSSAMTEEVPEDYIYLLLLMKEKGDKDYDKVARVVDEWIDKDQARLKEELKKVDNKRLWRRLLHEYFPDMRAARAVLVFKKYIKMDDQPAPEGQFTGQYVPEVSCFPEIPVKERLPRRELLSIKTNLLFDFAYVPGYDRFCPIPNIAIEYYPLHGHFTYGASFDCPWWQHYWDHKYFQIRNYQIETRYYLRSGDVDLRGYGNGAAFRGWYLQGYAHAGLYGICFDENRGWEGEGLGAGVGIGYVMPLSHNGHWRLEFGLQVGYFWTKYDPFQYECPVDPTEQDHLYYYKWTLDADLFKKRQHHFTWVGPTRVGITLSYDLIYRKRHL